MRKPWARSATIEPMLPQPMIPRVLPVISTPKNRFFSHLPACVDTSACGIWRASASIKVIACSAVVIELPKGVFITMMPFCVAAGISTLSTPMPARPMTFRFLAFSRTFGVTLVAERIARPSNCPISSASLSLSAPSFGWKSTSTPRSLKICTAAGERASEISTLGAMRAFRKICDGKKRRRVARRRAKSGGLGKRFLRLGEGPVEPLRQRLDVARLDRGAAPDAQPRRGVAIGVDVVGDALLLEDRAEILHEGRLRFRRQLLDLGIDHLQA